MKSIYALIATLLVSQISLAGILIEPYVGMSQQNATLKDSDAWTPPGDSSGKSTGTVMGARLGYKILLFWLALDYNTVSGTYKPTADLANQGAFNVETPYTKSQPWLDVGFDFPILFRAWVGVGASQVWNLKYKDPTTNVYADTDFKGSGTKVGLGFSGLPFLSINVEYIMNTYSKLDMQGNYMTAKDADVKTLWTEAKDNSVQVTVSAPFNLF